MVTAAKPFYSAWFSTQRRRNRNDTTHWSGSAPELLHRLYSAGGWKELRDRMEIGTAAEICGQLRPSDEVAVEVMATCMGAKRKELREQYGFRHQIRPAIPGTIDDIALSCDPKAAVSRRGGAARQARNRGQRESVQVMTHSVNKTDPNDARNLALYLAKDLLEEVRMKDKARAQIASLTQTRDTMVKLHTALQNRINNIVSAHGINLSKESLALRANIDETLTAARRVLRLSLSDSRRRADHVACARGCQVFV